jgi:hypothetical protein
MLFPSVLEVFNWNCIVALLHPATATTIANEETRGHYSTFLLQRLART